MAAAIANADATERGSRRKNQSSFGSPVLSTSSNRNIKVVLRRKQIHTYIRS